MFKGFIIKNPHAPPMSSSYYVRNTYGNLPIIRGGSCEEISIHKVYYRTFWDNSESFTGFRLCLKLKTR